LREGTTQPGGKPSRAAMVELRSVVTASVLLATTNEPKHITALSIKPILRTTRHPKTIIKTKAYSIEAAH